MTLAIVLTFVVLLEGVQESYAQPIIRLVPGRAQTGALFDGMWRNSGAPTAKPYAQNSLREWLEIPLEGYLFNTNILRYGLS